MGVAYNARSYDLLGGNESKPRVSLHSQGTAFPDKLKKGVTHLPCVKLLCNWAKNLRVIANTELNMKAACYWMTN